MITFSDKPRRFLMAGAISVLAASITGCSDEESAKKPAAMPDGTYKVSSPTCVDTGKSPAYTNAVQPGLFRDFTDLISGDAVIAGTELKSTVSDADCTLTNIQKIFSNSGTVITFTQQSSNTWTPAACKMTVSVDSKPIEVDQDLQGVGGTTKVYANSDVASQGGFFDVVPAGDTYTLTLGIAFNDYGCTNGTKFQWVWTKQP
jgi:hypothetical protein